MKKLLILIFLNSLFYSIVSATEQNSNNYLKWKVEFNTLSEKNKLTYCYPFYGKLADILLYTHIFYTLKNKENNNLKEAEQFAKTNYVKNIFRQHLIYDNLIMNQLDPLSNNGLMTPELKETFVKNNDLMSNSQFLLKEADLNISKSGIPDLCDKRYDQFLIDNKEALKEKFKNSDLVKLENIFLEEFENRFNKLIIVFRNNPLPDSQ